MKLQTLSEQSLGPGHLNLPDLAKCLVGAHCMFGKYVWKNAITL